MASPWWWKRSRVQKVVKRRNRIRNKAQRQWALNNIIILIAVSPVIAMSIIFMALKPFGLLIQFLRKPIAVGIAGIFGVMGAYWSEIWPIPEFIQQDPDLLFKYKWVMPAIAFGSGFWISSELYKD
jgi:hypothetical protein